MLIIEDVQVKWNKSNRSHFESLGYTFTRTGDLFIVKTSELTKGSHTNVKVLCDYCEEVVEKQFKTYLTQNQKSTIKKDCCKHCQSKKTEESNLFIYGVTNVMHVEQHKKTLEETIMKEYGVRNVSYSPEIVEKRKETSRENYGVDSYFQCKEFFDNRKEKWLGEYGVEWYTQTPEYSDKVKNSSLKNYGVDHHAKSDIVRKKMIEGSQAKYGVDNPFQAEVVKAKIVNHNIENYGVAYYTQTDEFSAKVSSTWNEKSREELNETNSKREKTTLEKYGVRHVQQSPDVRKKTMRTMFKNRTAPSSKQQIHICNLVQGELNYPVGNSFLDIAFIDEKIFLEYDGGGHDLQVKFGKMTKEEFHLKDRRRTFNMFDKGWKEIRVVTSTDKLPSDFEILRTIEKSKSFLITGKTKSVIVNWDDRTVLFGYKKKVRLDVFLLDNFELQWEVS